jgi:putative FmdB family regulatory protein
MATYSFYCKGHQETFEHTMSPDDLPLKQCPICGQPEPERIFQPINSKVPGGFGKSWEHTGKKG